MEALTYEELRKRMINIIQLERYIRDKFFSMFDNLRKYSWKLYNLSEFLLRRMKGEFPELFKEYERGRENIDDFICRNKDVLGEYGDTYCRIVNLLKGRDYSVISVEVKGEIAAPYDQYKIYNDIYSVIKVKRICVGTLHRGVYLQGKLCYGRKKCEPDDVTYTLDRNTVLTYLVYNHYNKIIDALKRLKEKIEQEEKESRKILEEAKKLLAEGELLLRLT